MNKYPSIVFSILKLWREKIIDRFLLTMKKKTWLLRQVYGNPFESILSPSSKMNQTASFFQKRINKKNEERRREIKQAKKYRREEEGRIKEIRGTLDRYIMYLCYGERGWNGEGWRGPFVPLHHTSSTFRLSVHDRDIAHKSFRAMHTNARLFLWNGSRIGRDE